jgi:hypothetical protein
MKGAVNYRPRLTQLFSVYEPSFFDIADLTELDD